MRLIDCATGLVVQTFSPMRSTTTAAPAAMPSLPPSLRMSDVCFSPGDGGLVLWGNLLWDVRLPHPVGPGGCCPPRHTTHIEPSFLELHGTL